MENLKQTIISVITSFIVSIVVLFGFTSLLKQDQEIKQYEPTLGSVQIGSSYQSTTTAQGITAGTYTLTAVPGVLGSIVVVSTSAVGGFTVYDATDAGTTTLVALPASTPAGTYTFDMNVFRGLRITVPSGFSGQFITTYRP